MKHYFIPTLALITGLGLSITSGYYSIVGLLTIFSTGLIGFILLEVAKITSTLYVHHFWNQLIAPVKWLTVITVITLSLITSGGVFGYYSKASQSGGAEVKINANQVSLLEGQLALEQKKYSQLQSQISQYNELQMKLPAETKTAARERKRLQQEIGQLSGELKVTSQAINQINKELLPLQVEVSKREIEIGPLLYFAKLFYGEEYKQHSEQLLTYLIVLIALLFDPLAIGLILMAQQGYKLIPKEVPATPIKEPSVESVHEQPVQTPTEPDSIVTSDYNPIIHDSESEYMRNLIDTMRNITGK